MSIGWSFRNSPRMASKILLVRFHIEALRLQDVDRLVHRIALQHERTENGLLQFGGLRRKLPCLKTRLQQ